MPERQRQREAVAGQIERPDSDCVIDRVEKKIDQQTPGPSRVQKTQNGLHLDLQLAVEAEMPLGTFPAEFS